ncbi:MAG: FIST C-terminal domain-containing protein, partial [Saprospiraceae bacterium]
LRSPLISNETDRSLMLAGGVQTGDQFRFSISPGLEVVDQTIAAFQDLKDQISEADALLLFSCKGRHAALGPMIEDEVKGIYDHWQQPMIGFFSYGEIGADHSGKCDFHNETCSLIVLREK